MKKTDDPIVICSYARTPVGAFGKSLAKVPAHELGAIAAKAAIERAGITPDVVDEWIVGCVGAVGNDAYVSRRVAIAAGAREDSTALTINRLCGSSMQAIGSAAYELMVGESDIVVAAGTENMSNQPYLDYAGRDGYTMGNRTLVDGTLVLITDPFSQLPMGVTAETVATRFGVSREEQDAYAAESQRRAQEAIANGAVAGEIAPVTISSRKGDIVVDTDEHPRAGITVEKLAAMRPVFAKDGSVTAGNASGVNDGAAAVVVTRASVAEQRGLTPLVEIVDFTKVGIDPAIMGYAPVPAVQRLLERNQLGVDDIDWYEINEAFAAQAVAVVRDLGLDKAKVNPLGGAISWGHPIGATGAIITSRVVHNLVANNLNLGMASMCIGGGQAVGIILKRI